MLFKSPTPRQIAPEEILASIGRGRQVPVHTSKESVSFAQLSCAKRRTLLSFYSHSSSQASLSEPASVSAIGESLGESASNRADA